MLEVQTALCILSLLGKRRGVMRANKSFMLYFVVVIHGSQNYIKQNVTNNLLGVQADFPTNLYLKQRKHALSLKTLQQLHRCHALQFYNLIAVNGLFGIKHYCALATIQVAQKMK